MTSNNRLVTAAEDGKRSLIMIWVALSVAVSIPILGMVIGLMMLIYVAVLCFKMTKWYESLAWTVVGGVIVFSAQLGGLYFIPISGWISFAVTFIVTMLVFRFILVGKVVPIRKVNGVWELTYQGDMAELDKAQEG